MRQIVKIQHSVLLWVLFFLFCSYVAPLSAAVKQPLEFQQKENILPDSSDFYPFTPELDQKATKDKNQVGLENEIPFTHNELISLVPDFSSSNEDIQDWDDSLPSNDGDTDFSLNHFINKEYLSDNENEQLEQQRKIFSQALRALNKGKRSTFRKLRAELDSYPLKPYLDYYEFRRYLSSASEKDLNNFITDHNDLAVIPHLEKAWLYQLARKQEWEKYLIQYEEMNQNENSINIHNAKLDCYYHWAQFKNKRYQEAFEGAKKLWLIGKSQEKACDPLFAKWKSSNLFNEEQIWKRIQLSINNRQFKFARYLAKALDKDQQKRLTDWIYIYRHPERIIARSPYLEDTIERNGMVFNILMRLIDKDPLKAIEAWELYEPKLAFTEDQNKEFKTSLATILELRGLPEAEEWLVEANPDGSNELLNQLAIRRALSKSDWIAVVRLIENLPDKQKYSSQFRYWYARSLEAIASENLVPGEKDTLQAEIIYQQLANERSYYGFLASQKSQLPMRLVPMPVSIQASEIDTLKSIPALQRALEFYRLGQFVNGRREWRKALSGLSDKQKLVAAKLASEWNWHSEAIRSASDSSYRDRLKLRFPLAHNETVKQQANITGLNPDWIYAIIRQESMFMSDARSHVGATGMMQLLPTTARIVARSSGIPYKGLKDLLNPETNITLGTYYMSQLLERFNYNIVLATAAYNAGPHRVDKWLANEHYPENIPGDIWIEMIPFKETRHYVKQVLSYQVIYQHLMGNEPDLLSSIQVISSNLDNIERKTITD